MSCLGQRRRSASPWSKRLSPPHLLQRVIADTTTIMSEHGVARIVAISAGGVGDSRERCHPLIRRLIRAGSLRVAYRDLDGTIAVALNSSDPDEEPMVIRSDGSGEGLDNDHEIVPTEWPNDGEAHWLELRLPREELDESTASVYLDGALVFRGIPVPRLSRRGSTIVGVSVQADLDRRMRLGVEQIEIFRRRPKIERGGANR